MLVYLNWSLLSTPMYIGGVMIWCWDFPLISKTKQQQQTHGAGGELRKMWIVVTMCVCVGNRINEKHDWQSINNYWNYMRGEIHRFNYTDPFSVFEVFLKSKFCIQIVLQVSLIFCSAKRMKLSIVVCTLQVAFLHE